MDRYDVFISYNSQDRDAALELDGQLRTRGFRPWIDVHDAVPGQRWLDQLERIIESTPAVLVLVGASGLGPWEAEEIAAALLQAVKRTVPVVPVFMKGAPPEAGPKSLPLFLGVRVGVDLRTESLDRLVKLLGQAVGLPPAVAGGGQGSGSYFESSPIRWLHLSDFHVGRDDYAQHRIFDQIHRHVREGVDDKGTPDLVFITGDIAYRGKDEEYATFYEDFLGPLVEALGDDWDGMIYTIPGNHDVDRSVARYFDSKAICKPRSRFFDASSEGSQHREMLLPRFRAYLEAEKQQGNDSPNGWLTSKVGAFSERREVRGHSLGIVGVNTAWLCQDEDDRHQLTPGIALLEEALGRVRDCEVCIVLGHHPLDWLHDDHIGPIRALLGECHALYLHGHLHRSQGQRESGAGQGFLAVQAGSCFQARDGEPWINGLLWAELDLGHWEVRLQPRHWNVQNRDWPLTSGAFPERLRQERTDWWCFSLPGAGVGGDLKSSTNQTGRAPRPTAAADTSRRATPHSADAPTPTPQRTSKDQETERLSNQLEGLYDQREQLTIAGEDTRAIASRILDVCRLLRKGPQLRPGEFLLDGRFRLLEPLGQGGFGMVWKAYDRQLRRLVAVKVLHGQHSEDRTRRERFFRGARKMVELAHPNIVRVLEPQCEDDGWFFFVMEFVAGGDFNQAVIAGKLTEDEKLAIVRQVGEVLEFAHQRGVIHRDVKPANILLDEDRRPKLTDFDLVLAEDTTGLTRSQAMMGTLNYAAPETLESAKDAGPPADVYSLASTAIFALLGGPLPRGYYRDPGSAIASLGCSPALARVLTRATAADPAKRFPSADAFVSAVEEATVIKGPTPVEPSKKRPPVGAAPAVAAPPNAAPAIAVTEPAGTVVDGAVDSTAAPPSLSRIALPEQPPSLPKRVPSSPSPPVPTAAQVPVMAPQAVPAEDRPSTPKRVEPAPKRVVPVVEAQSTPGVERVAPPSIALEARRGELDRERFGANARRWGLVSGLVGAVVVVMLLTVWRGQLSDWWNAIFPPGQTIEKSDSVDTPVTEREDESNELIGPPSEVAVVANFTFSPASPVAGQQVQFTDTSTGNSTTWEWDFENPPNGTDSNLQNPTWTFEDPGTYAVELTVSSHQVDIDPVTINVVVGPSGPGELSFSLSSYQVDEDVDVASIVVRRTGGSNGAVSVRCNTANGTAEAGQDYGVTTDTLNWADGDTANKSCMISIIDDTEEEDDETIKLALTNFIGSAAPGSPTTTTLTILANDSQDDFLRASDSALLLKVVGLSDNISIVEEPGSSNVISKMEPLKPYFVLGDTRDTYRISSRQEAGSIQGFVSKQEVAIWNTREGLHFVADAFRQDRRAAVAAWESEERIRQYAKTTDIDAYGPTFREELQPRTGNHAIIPYPLLYTKEIKARDGATKRIHQVLIPAIVAGTIETDLTHEELQAVAGAVTFCVVFDATASMGKYAISFAKTIDEMLSESGIDAGLAAAGFVLFRGIKDAQRFEVVQPMPLEDAMDWLRGRVRDMEGGDDPAKPVLDAMILAQNNFSWSGGTAIRGARRIAIVVATKDATLDTVPLTGERGLNAKDVGRRLLEDSISVFALQAGYEDRGNLVNTLSTLAEETGGEFYAADRSRRISVDFSEKLERLLSQRIDEGAAAAEDLRPHIYPRVGGGTVIALNVLDEDMRARLEVAAPDFHISTGGLVITKAWVFEEPNLYREEILIEKELLEWLVRFFDVMTDSTLDAMSLQKGTANVLEALIGENLREGIELQELLEKRLGIHFTTNLLSFELEHLGTLSPKERTLLQEEIRNATGALSEFLDMNARRFNREPRIWMSVSYLP